ncbi:SRPBCC family protein [Kineococcus gynurae]|uniref:SRPBCC family protein n=1 Tax=Kineococcus gynurae TaxID=452979 RepID=A0ABV5LNE5_9ACTN
MSRVRFRVAVRMAASPEAVFAALTDWPAQARWIPFTRIRRRPGPRGAVGEEFSTVSALGPFALRDPMRVTRLDPPLDGRPGRVDLAKTGTVLGGTATIEVAAEGGGSRVVWTEDLLVRPAPLARAARLGGPLPGLLGRVAFGGVLLRARRDLERGAVRR